MDVIGVDISVVQVSFIGAKQRNLPISHTWALISVEGVDRVTRRRHKDNVVRAASDSQIANPERLCIRGRIDSAREKLAEG